tara:strand:- start:7046 stop:7426 length:381 start_codon:yes stop_codon:yes gene_type:complete
MLLAAFEPGPEMAIANFSLAIFFLFTISLPLLLITRGDKTESNRDFISATVNPWSQIDKEIALTPVVISGITQPSEFQPNLEVIPEINSELISESEEVISIQIKDSEDLSKSSTQVLKANDEILAA